MPRIDPNIFDRISGTVTDEGAYLRLNPESPTVKGTEKASNTKKKKKSTVAATPEAPTDKAVREIGNKKQLDSSKKTGVVPKLNKGSTTITSPVPGGYKASSSNLQKLDFNMPESLAPKAPATAWTPGEYSLGTRLSGPEPTVTSPTPLVVTVRPKTPVEKAAVEAASAQTPEAASDAATALTANVEREADLPAQPPAVIENATAVAHDTTAMAAIKKKDPSTWDNVEKIAMALSPALTILAGYALGGRTGALIGGQAMFEGIKEWGKAKEADKKIVLAKNKIDNTWKEASYKGSDGQDYLAYANPKTGEFKKISDPTTGSPILAKAGAMDVALAAITSREKIADAAATAKVTAADKSETAKEKADRLKRQDAAMKTALNQPTIPIPQKDGTNIIGRKVFDSSGGIVIEPVKDSSGNPVIMNDKNKGKTLQQIEDEHKAAARGTAAGKPADGPKQRAVGPEWSEPALKIEGYGYARTPKDRVILTEMIPIKGEIDGNIDTIIKIRKKSPLGSILPSSDTEAAKQASANIKTRLFKLRGMGVPTGRDEAMINNIFPADPTAVRWRTLGSKTDTVLHEIEAFKKEYNKSFDTSLKLRTTPKYVAPFSGSQKSGGVPVGAPGSMTGPALPASNAGRVTSDADYMRAAQIVKLKSKQPQGKVKINGIVYTVMPDGMSADKGPPNVQP